MKSQELWSTMKTDRQLYISDQKVYKKLQSSIVEMLHKIQINLRDTIPIFLGEML